MNLQYQAYYDTPIHFVTKNPKSGSIQDIDGLLKHPDYSINHRYPDLIILKLTKPIKVNIEGFKSIPSAYYNQFFNQKLKNEEIEKQQYRPQDRLQRTTAFGVPCFTQGSYLENSQFFFKSQLVEIMSDSNCKPLLTEILRDH